MVGEGDCFLSGGGGLIRHTNDRGKVIIPLNSILCTATARVEQTSVAVDCNLHDSTHTKMV